mgnify:CR=1 FL=1
MTNNRFRYPPAPPNGEGTFSDNLVGNQWVDGTSQMSNGNFTITENYQAPQQTNFNLGGFSSPITLESMGMDNTENLKVSNSLEIFVNHDTSDLSNMVLYGSLKKRLSVAVNNVINSFPAALFIDGIDVNNNIGNTTASNISYDEITDRTTFRVPVNYLSNPFVIEFTTNGELVIPGISPEQVINNMDMFGNSASTAVKIAEGKVTKLRNLTKEYEKYVLTFNNELKTTEYKVVGFTPESVTTNFFEVTVKGKPFGTSTITTKQFYIKPSLVYSELELRSLNGVEAFLMTRDVTPIYTAKFKLVKETGKGKKFYSHNSLTWPMSDAVNLDIMDTPYITYIKKLSDIGDELDGIKTNLVSRFLTAPTLKEFDTSDQKVEKTLQMYGRGFDDIKTFVDGIAYMTNVTYDRKKNIPNELTKNFARTLGWSTPSTLNKTGFLDSVLGVTTPQYSGSSVGMTPVELDVELYRRILMNTGYLFKSKGTRKSIEFLLTLLGAPEALIEFNEYVVIADKKIDLKLHNMVKWEDDGSGGLSASTSASNNNFLNRWSTISGGTYGISAFRYNVILSDFYTKTGTTSHNFKLQDYPIDQDGYPTRPRTNNSFFFQRGAGWFERNEEHKSNKVLDIDNCVTTGCNKSYKYKFSDFTWGGFWTMGEQSNEPGAPYLDRFRRFPHMSFGYGLTREIDDKKSWVRYGHGTQIRDWEYDNRASYYQTEDERLVLNVKNVDLSLNIGQALVYDVWQQSVNHGCFFSADTSMTGGTLYENFKYPLTDSGKWFGGEHTQTVIDQTDGGAIYSGSKFVGYNNDWSSGAFTKRVFRRSKGATVRFEVCVNDRYANTEFGFVSDYVNESNFTTTTNQNRIVEGIKFHNRNITVITDEDNNPGTSEIHSAALGTGAWTTNVDKYFKVDIELKPTGGAKYKIYQMGETTPMSEYETYGNILESVRFGIINNNSNNEHLIINNVYVFDEAKNQPTIKTNNLNFKEFKKDFWRVFIDVRDRMTVSDGKTGGYHMLQQIYLSYLKSICGNNNQYTYNKMVDYSQSMGDYWVRIIEQMVPATTLWTSGLKVENSVLHRDKFVYKCFDKNGESLSSAMAGVFNVSVTGYTGVQLAQIGVGSRGINGNPLGSSSGVSPGTSIFSPGATNNFFNVGGMSVTLSGYGWVNNYNMV